MAPKKKTRKRTKTKRTKTKAKTIGAKTKTWEPYTLEDFLGIECRRGRVVTRFINTDASRSSAPMPLDIRETVRRMPLGGALQSRGADAGRG